MSTIGTQILEQIARIKNARNKARAQAVALGLKATSIIEFPLENIDTMPGVMDKPFYTGKSVNSTTQQKLRLHFINANTADEVSAGAFFEIKVYSKQVSEGNLIAWHGLDQQSNITMGGENDVIEFTFPSYEIEDVVIILNTDAWTGSPEDCLTKCEYVTIEKVQETSNLDSVADAFASMSVKKAETITANTLLTDGFYKGCNVNVPAGDGACEHVQTNATVDFGTGTVIFTDMAGKVLETSVYDANDIEKDKYVVNEVYVTNVPDTTALEQQVETLENELENISTELEGM